METKKPQLDKEKLDKLINELVPALSTDDPNYIGPVESASGTVYKIGEGVYTGKQGWLEFCDALEKAAKEMFAFSDEHDKNNNGVKAQIQRAHE